MSLEQDRKFMRMALREAKKGRGRTAPNPCVGAVIVKDGKVVSKGYHRKAGTPHAEVHALARAGEEASGATMYVTLEPCNHTGRTPPCSHAVAAAGIVRVVVGMGDPNPLVDGTGIDYLRGRGIEVVGGVLEEQCREIIRPFLKHITTGQPWMVMKAGVSLDGKLNYDKGRSGWITGPESVREAHRLRDIHDAILVGRGTAAIDDPSLTTRLPRGRGRDPLRLLIDSDLQIPHTARIYQGPSEAGAWVFCGEDADRRRMESLTRSGVRVLPVPRGGNGGLDLEAVVRRLGKEGLTSVLVEGGAALHGAMLAQRLFDYAHLFISPIFAGENGIPLLAGYQANSRDDAVRILQALYRRCGDDMMVAGSIAYP